jgi:hypothetical protein
MLVEAIEFWNRSLLKNLILSHENGMKKEEKKQSAKKKKE